MGSERFEMIEFKKIWDTGSWQPSDEADACVAEIVENIGITEACAKLLYRRGFHSLGEVKDFLGMRAVVLLDPFLMKDMDKAARRVLDAIENKENIAIYGDYDADGISATALLFLYLEEIGEDVPLGYYIPDRHAEGYGMSVAAIDKLAARGVQLIITVDNGISAAKEVEYAASLGIDVVVTDHHECPAVLPEAVAVVDPHREDCQYPFKDLAGVGVAFKLAIAIERIRRGNEVKARTIDEEIYRKYSDLAALGTVADVMPVLGENRIIVTYGLNRMERAPRPGIKALAEKANARKNGKLLSSSISFAFAPRINAAGRMDKPSKALELLLLSNTDAQAETAANVIAEALCDYNKDRQSEEARISEEAYQKIEETFSPEDRIIIVDGDAWHSGVIGIVASRIIERYHRPAIIITYNDASDRTGSAMDIGKGSGRSIDGINLIEAISATSDYLVKFGGHESAAGLSVARGNVEVLRQKMNSFLKEKYDSSVFDKKTIADLALSAQDINMKLAQDLVFLEPYGTGNRNPVFYLDCAKIIKSYPIGTGKHLKMLLEKDGFQLDAVMFNADYEAFNFTLGECVDIMFQLEINEYNGRKSAQLNLKDIRRAQIVENEISYMKTRYEELKKGGGFSLEDDFLPTRDNFARLYMVLRNLEGTGRNVIEEKQLYHLALNAPEININYTKFLLMLDILQEMHLCEIRRIDEKLIDFHICPTTEKVDLEMSQILISLKERLA